MAKRTMIKTTGTGKSNGKGTGKPSKAPETFTMRQTVKKPMVKTIGELENRAEAEAAQAERDGRIPGLEQAGVPVGTMEEVGKRRGALPILPPSATKAGKVQVLLRQAVEQMSAADFLVGLGKLGFTVPEISRAFNLPQEQLYQALKNEPHVMDAYIRALEEPNKCVEASLFRKAMGFTAYEKEYDGNGQIKKVKTKQVPGDITAIIFWLKNRSLGKWQDVTKIQVDTPLAERLNQGHARLKEKQGELHVLAQQQDGSYAPTDQES